MIIIPAWYHRNWKGHTNGLTTKIQESRNYTSYPHEQIVYINHLPTVPLDFHNVHIIQKIPQKKTLDISGHAMYFQLYTWQLYSDLCTGTNLGLDNAIHCISICKSVSLYNGYRTWFNTHIFSTWLLWSSFSIVQNLYRERNRNIVFKHCNIFYSRHTVLLENPRHLEMFYINYVGVFLIYFFQARSQFFTFQQSLFRSTNETFFNIR